MHPGQYGFEHRQPQVGGITPAVVKVTGLVLVAQLFDGRPIKYVVGFDERSAVGLDHHDLGLLVE
ncbi:hypothetical protein C7N83_12700 [Neisseria iguanae]|uniref:Uncharacterized protein n=1 Tax=Neisseria iguanae TaxID=90242 RepID=A0A2P7TX83_9NEIS|nr:hypothetical protein C7N83_12700 [Neisseria iguanae]